MTTATLLVLCAIHSVAFGLFHLTFWKLLGSPRSLAQTHAVNRGVMQILNLRLTWVFFCVGAACLLVPREHLNNPLGA